VIETLFSIILLGGVALAFYGAWRSGQFKEEIRWLVFTEEDARTKLTPDQFKLWKAAQAAQKRP
jgi:hypothetical protein